MENGRGWGLKTMEDVVKGQLVFEYVGEVIDDDGVRVRWGERGGGGSGGGLRVEYVPVDWPQKRMHEHQELHPHDHNMYVMELENGYFLDAR
jgi:hypothetical protein